MKVEENRPIVIDYEIVSTKIKVRRFISRLPEFFRHYFAGMFPILQWIHRYNFSWLVQDVIAGVTVGIVIVPQSMAYAKIANLDPQYGLYTSFVGVTLYCFFGTSKDISIGPISTVSLLVGTIVSTVIKANPTITPSEVAVTLGLFAGIISIIISLFKLGILVDFIPEPAIAGYMTGSAITIVLSQWPKLFGLPNVVTHASPCQIFISILKDLPHTRLDVAFGLSSLVFLYSVKFICARYTCRSPVLQKGIFLFGIMRNGLIVILGTLISFLINIGKETSPISVIQKVPAGFKIGVPSLHMDILQEAGGILPSIVLILILEHISVAKSFGRIYDYQVDPNQEILAIGVSNVVGAFFGGYPATGAFSRTAIMARSGSRTPIAGVFSGAVVVLALYALTPAFYYIPNAVLAAVVIHAVSDLVSGSQYLKELWRSSTAEFFVWVCAVLVTILVDVQMGIYAAVGLSMVIMLYRLARPPIKTLSRLALENGADETTTLEKFGSKTVTDCTADKEVHYVYVDEVDPNFEKHVTTLPSGILLLKICDSILYPNAEHIAEAMVHAAKQKSRCGNIADINKSDSEKSWSQNTQSVEDAFIQQQQLPVLKALVLDFAAVCRLDSTALQNLIIVRDTLDRYADRSVEWHFTGLQSQSVRASLLAAGFGSFTPAENCRTSSSLRSVNASLVSLASAQNHPLPRLATSKCNLYLQNVVNNKSGLESSRNFVYDLETNAAGTISNTNTENNPPSSLEARVASPDFKRNYFYTPTDKYPCFHWDADSAVRSICLRWYNETQSPQVEKLG